MRSDRNGSAERASRTEWLFSQGLGVICGQATVLLLAIGSIALASTRDGASASIAMDDLLAFFAPASVVHLWFYLLVGVLTLYALNTALATYRNVVRKWRAGIRTLRFYAPAVIHVAFLFGLLAHGDGGIGGAELDRLLLGPGWTQLGDGREARVTELKVDSNPDDSMKQLRASVETRDADGSSAQAEVYYNGPLSRGLGSELMLLVRPQSVPTLRLARGEDRCAVEARGICELGDLRVELLYLHPPLQPGKSAFAQLRVRNPDGSAGEAFPLAPGESKQLSDGSSLSAGGIGPSPAILLRHRRAPGNPLALLSCVLLTLGLLMMWRRFSPRAAGV
ncbi:MAG: hypothetical protein JRF15_10815 [Deltaproteobacteria bacterium]|jgi:hypothetical protein|nr:hypothetical protein [Deltaproteobacteria bacterium]